VRNLVLTIRAEKRLSGFEGKLRRMFVSKKEKVVGGRRKIHDTEFKVRLFYILIVLKPKVTTVSCVDCGDE
jgi:hypothetical protein